MSSLAELEALGLAIFENRISANFDLASVVILIYDYILTVKFEIELVWGTPWNIGKILYMSTRYCVFVDAMMLAFFHFATGESVSARTCSLVYEISGWFIFWGGCLAEIILIFRTWAVWGKSSRVAIGLPILLVIVVIPLVYLTRIGLTSISFADVTKLPIQNLQSCFVIKDKSITILWDYVVILGFETVILILTLIRGFQHYRHTSSSLVSTLYADGILYYVYLLMLSIANVLFLGLVEKKTGATLILMQRVFHSMLTGRMLLHLRMAVLRNVAHTSLQDCSTVEFARRRHAEFSTSMMGYGTWLHEPEPGLESTRDNGDRAA